MSQPGARTACVRRRRATGHCRRRTPGGFTLVELMTTVFVTAILITIAVPSFKHITVSSRLTTTANGMVGALNAARLEAIKRNADTLFCGRANNGGDKLGTACGLDSPGAVYTLITTAAGASSAARVQAAPAASVANIHFETVNAIRFTPQGLGQPADGSQPAYAGTVAEICSSSIGSSNIRTIRMTTGSILKTITSSGACQ